MHQVIGDGAVDLWSSFSSAMNTARNITYAHMHTDQPSAMFRIQHSHAR
jgi:hypothetical protein